MTAPYKLDELGVKAQDIDGVYISHLHADHIGGMEWLGFMTYFTKSGRPKLYCEHQLLEQLWDQSLRGGMKCLQGIDGVTYSTYFDPRPIVFEDDDYKSSCGKCCYNGKFEWEGYTFKQIQTLHVVSGSKFSHSYGLMIESVDGTSARTFITTDTQFTHPAPLQAFYDCADIIFHDCETGPFRSGVHAHYDDMVQHLDVTTKEKMWLYHYSKTPDTSDGTLCNFIETFDTFCLVDGVKVNRDAQV